MSSSHITATRVAAVVVGAVGAVALVRLAKCALSGSRDRSSRRRGTVGDQHETAFPTAQWVCALRAVDAQSARPRIGSNVGAGPDTLAEVLAGELGFEMMDAMMKLPTPEQLPPSLLAMSREASAKAMIDRTQYFDEAIMAAVAGGCKQLVLVAAGLDTRAWRLPLDASLSVFEVDCAACFRYKNQRLATLSPRPALRCGRRVCVEADLADPAWLDALRGAGFSPHEPSLFLVEGLLMYLPEDAPARLLREIRSVMAPGSTLTGDCLVNLVAVTDQSVVKRFGTEWTFDVPNAAALQRLLESAGLQVGMIEPVFGNRQLYGPADVEPDAATRMAGTIKHLRDILISFPMWPGAATDYALNHIARGTDGLRAMLTNMVNDPHRNLGFVLSGYDDAARAQIVEAMLGSDLPEVLDQLAAVVGPERAKVGRVGRFLEFVVFVWRMVVNGGATGSYVVYKCTA